MKKKITFLTYFTITFFSISVFSQSKIIVTCNHADAKIFKMVGEDKIEPAIGIGSVELRLSKKEMNKIVLEKEGYEPVIRSFPRTRKWPKNIQVNMESRLVSFNSEPFDASIYLDGTYVGKKSAQLIIPKGGQINVELRKEGFKPVSKTYYNQDGKDIAPLKDGLILVDRIVQVKVIPSDSEIFVDNSSQGIGSATVSIPKGKCVLIKAEKEGFIGSEKVICNKENEEIPPLKHQFNLIDRLIKIATTPDNAEIYVDGKVVGVGVYDLKVSKNECVEVLISKDGFLQTIKNYCNTKDFQEPPSRDHIKLDEDEAFMTSVSTDLANVNFNIVVREGIEEAEAWKLLSQIVTTEFDVLEVIDKETGYLRTAWEVQGFKGSTIRTRVIVKMGDSDPLKYIMKISSERAEGRKSVKDDQSFEEWSRILKKYKNIIEEAQSRL